MTHQWMKKTWSRIALSTGLALLAACAADAGEDAASEAAGSEAAPTVKETGLVASLALENGNALEFYDVGTTAIIAERGEAYATPLYKPAEDHAESVTAVWNRLARGRAAPPELLALEERLKTYTGAAHFEADPGTPAYDPPLEEEEVEAKAPAGTRFDKSNCGNGCCNRDWILHDFALCRSGSNKWFIFDEPGPSKNGSSVMQMQGFVCAASGVVWDITVDGRLTRFRLSRAQFLTVDIVKVQTTPWWDFTNPFVTHSVQTVVRTTDPGTATYCGFMARS
jgi:hypothetical protein